MDAQVRTRSCSKLRNIAQQSTPRGAKQIVVPMDRETYDRIWSDAVQVREFLLICIESPNWITRYCCSRSALPVGL